jgi:hypothetical protein
VESKEGCKAGMGKTRRTNAQSSRRSPEHQLARLR